MTQPDEEGPVRYEAHGATAELRLTADGDDVSVTTEGADRLLPAERSAFEEGIANQRTILLENERRRREAEEG